MRDRKAVPEVHVCEVDGCNFLAPFGRYCRDCEGEIKALREMMSLADKRREDRRARRSVRRRLRDFFTAINLIVVLGSIAYLAIVYGYAFVEWLQLGGWK